MALQETRSLRTKVNSDVEQCKIVFSPAVDTASASAAAVSGRGAEGL